MNTWIEYQQIDFASDFAWINIDTRDFHAVVVGDMRSNTLELPPNYNANKEKYFYTPEEIKALIDRYFEESGGKGSWRMFSLEGATDVSGWDMKYIPIVKHKCGLLVCKRIRDDRLRPIKKSTLSLPVKQTYLNHIAE